MRAIKPFLLVVMLCPLLSGCITTMMLAATADAKLQCLSDPDDNPKPDRTRGEFPFVLTYMSKGKQEVIHDTQICQFKGRTCSMYGRDDIWESSLASGRKGIVLLKPDENQVYFASLGSCPMMMSEATYQRVDNDPEYPASVVTYKGGKPVSTSGGIWVRGELDKLGIRVESFEQASSGSAATAN